MDTEKVRSIVVDDRKLSSLRAKLENANHATLAWLAYRLLDEGLREDSKGIEYLAEMYDLSEFLKPRSYFFQRGAPMFPPKPPKNAEGGYDPDSKRRKRIYKRVDLITLPDDVEGTNCGNCKHATTTSEGSGLFCLNDEIKDYVTERMCCSLWDNSGVERKF